MKNELKIVIDILMLILFALLMRCEFTGVKNHEILGILIFILFLIHNILNINWYKAIFKGKYTLKRLIPFFINLLLCFAMIELIISGIMISRYLFYFLNIPITFFGIELHLFSASWGFILIAIHLGFHLKPMFNELKINKSKFKSFYYLIIGFIVVLGLYNLLGSPLLSDMFLVGRFGFFILYPNEFLFYCGYLSIILAISIISYLIFDRI